MGCCTPAGKRKVRPLRWELARRRSAAFAAPVFSRYPFILAVTLALGARAEQGQSPQISGSGKTTYENNEIIVRGDARVSDGRRLLLADEIHYNFQTETATAIGHVRFTRGPQRLLADSLIYRFANDSFTSSAVRVGSYPVYATGISANGSKDEVVVDHATVTFREPGPFVPALSAEKITFAPDKQLRAEGGHAGVGPVRPIMLPKFEQQLNEPLLPFIALSGGYRASLGVSMEMGLRLPVGSGLSLGGDFGIHTARGFMFGPAGNYVSSADPETLRGYFRSGFIRDHGAKMTDILGRPVPVNRGYIEWSHFQTLAPDLTLSAQLNYWKDSEILRDFRPRAFFAVQEPDTFVESVYTRPNYFVSLFARFRPNTFERVQERLPEVRFDLLPFAVGSGFYQQFNASAAVLREDPLLAGPKLGTDRIDAYYALTRPIVPHEWLAFTPIAGGRVTHYANTTGATAPGGYTRVLGEVGFDAELRSSATYDYKNELWKIDGLRHLLTPRLSYRYVPQADHGRPYIPLIDRDTFSTYLPPLGLGVTRNIDDLQALNTLRLGVDNTLQTRDATYGSRDLLVFNNAADFRFRRAVGDPDVSEIHTELAVMPVSWLSLGVYESFAPQSFTLRQFQSGLTVRDGEQWSFRLANHYLRRDTSEFSLDGDFRLNEAYQATGRLYYDARQRRFVEQAYGIRQNLDNTWRIEYMVTLYEGRSRESNFGFNVRIEAIRF